MNRIIFAIILTIFTTSLYAVTIPGFTPPTTREGGGSLSLQDLEGFRVLCGITTGKYTEDSLYTIQEIGSKYDFDLSKVVRDEGTHYCVMTAVDKAGRESLFSNEFQVGVTLSNPKFPIVPANTVIQIQL